MREYKWPGLHTEPIKSLNEAEGILWTLYCDVGYYLNEVDSKQIVPPKHALDMMLKHIHRELWDARELICDHIKKDEEGGGTDGNLD